MEDKDSVAKMMDSTSSKIQQLQRAFAELESYRAVTLNLKWKELEEHFHGLEKSLKRRFHELEDQEKVFENKTRKAREMLEKKEATAFAKEQASLQSLQEKRDVAVFTIVNAREKYRKVSSKDFGIVFNGIQGSPAVEEKPEDAVSTGDRKHKQPHKYRESAIPNQHRSPSVHTFFVKLLNFLLPLHNFFAMEDKDSVAKMMDSTSSKIQQLQRAFAELESYRAVTLNLKWKELEEHFHGLEKSLKRRFHELEDQEKVFENKTRKAREMLEKKEATAFAKEQASLQSLQEKRDVAVFTIVNAREKYRKVSSKDFGIVFNGIQGSPAVEEKPEDAVSTGGEDNLENVKHPPENR
ncbi:hypothetical protein RYX36_018346 [Vicia faba]